MSPVAQQSSVDAVCKAAVDLARAAAIEDAEDAALVGEHLGVVGTDERTAEHRFAYAGKAYYGWEWVVEVTRVPRAKTATVNEVVLLPGADALIAPPHHPWSERLEPGDLGVGDVFPTAEGDPRLILRIQESSVLPEQLEDRDILHEQGIGKPRALSAEGRSETAQRWYDSDHGPRAPIAEQAPASCRTCGFNVRLVGELGFVFGVCANPLSQEDGKVVSYDHGCGGHSEVVVTATQLWETVETRPEYEVLDITTTDGGDAVEPQLDHEINAEIAAAVVDEPATGEPGSEALAELAAEEGLGDDVDTEGDAG